MSSLGAHAMLWEMLCPNLCKQDSSNSNSLVRSIISNRWAVCFYFFFLILLSFIEIYVVNADSVDPDQTPHSAASGLGLHYLLLSILGTLGINGLLGPDTLGRIFAFVLTMETVFMTSCQSPSKERSTLKGKTLLPQGTNSFLLERTPFQKGQTKFGIIASPENVSFPLYIVLLTSSENKVALSSRLTPVSSDYSILYNPV